MAKATRRRGTKRTNTGPKTGSDETGDESGAKTHRAIWQGSIAFGLVQIPVRLVSAERSRELTFHQLDRRNLSRIRYERINEETGEKVNYADVVKGYEMKDGAFVVLEDEDFEKAAPLATHTIDVQDFVDRTEIPPAFFERPYFLVPDKKSDKAYGLIRDVLAKRGLAAIGLVVIRTRQHLCAVFPQGAALVLDVLRFDDELVAEKAVSAELPREAKATEKEQDLAERLVEGLTSKWDPSKYKDTYREALLAAIEHKGKTGKMPAAKKPMAPPAGDLLSLLQKSVAKTHKKKAA